MVNVKTLVQCFSKDSSRNSRKYKQMPNWLLTPLLTHLFAVLWTIFFTKLQKDHSSRDKVCFLDSLYSQCERGLISTTLIFLQFVNLADALISPISQIFLKGCSRFLTDDILCIYSAKLYLKIQNFTFINSISQRLQQVETHNILCR